MKACIKILFIASLGVACSLRVQGQETPLPQLHLITQSYGDSIVLRWAPNTYWLWQTGNKYGYKIERKAAGDREFMVVVAGPMKPYPLEEWKSSTDTTNVHVATAAQSLLGEVRMQPQNAITFSQKLLTADEQQNRMAFALYAAEFNIQAANGLALRWVDKNVQPNTKYYYRLSLYEQPKNSDVYSVITYQNTDDVYQPEPVTNVAVRENDGSIDVLWEKYTNDEKFTGYFVERSADGKNFRLLEEIPFKTLGGDKDTTHHVYTDEVPLYYTDYYYRIVGITSFADRGLYSEVVKGQSVDLSGPAPPSYIKAESLEETEVRITWEDGHTPPPDHAGYYIGRGRSIKGPFEKINEAPFPLDTREFTDRNPIPHIPNFYTVFAVDERGNENRSVVTMAVLPDYTPPAKPTGMIGNIDTLGIVSLAWEFGKEEDLMGYRVYRANAKNRDFIQITKAPIPGNFFMDTIPLNTLTEKVYYKIAAFDFNYNPSEYSEILELDRPDYIPPVSPVIKDYRIFSDSVQLFWAPSNSKDVLSQILYRKEAATDVWEPIAYFEAIQARYTDATVVRGKKYRYALAAVDDARLESDKSFAITAHVYDDGIREGQIILEGSFDESTRFFQLTWTYSEDGNTKYLVYRAKAGEPLRFYATASAEDRMFTDQAFYANEEGYEYAVKAVYPDGGESPFSNKVIVNF